MPTAQPQLGHQDLQPDAHRVLLAGSIEGLQYPPLCPNCGAPATDPLPITKVFMYNDQDEAGWRYRTAQATPFFCRTCLDRHYAEALPVTAVDRLKTVVFNELAIPTLALSVFGLFLLTDTAPSIVRNPQRQWPILAVIAALFLLALLCLRGAWRGSAYRRLPTQTPTSRAFDFGDNGYSMYRTTRRTYAIRNQTYAAAFEQLNAARSAALLGPEQRRRENKAFWTTATIIAALALGMYFMNGR